MGSFLKSEETIREYLLGRVSDETELEGLEDLLFTDEEFCSQVELVEDGLINDYVLGRLNQADTESFRSMLTDNPERRFKLDLTLALRERALGTNVKSAQETPSFFNSLIPFFRQPIYAGAFALLLITVISAAIYFTGRMNPDDQLAELRSIYRQARPTETRISTFDYAPLTQLRGAPEAGEQRRLRLVEIRLTEAAEKNPNGQTHHALGVFFLTQQKYADAIREFANSLKFDAKNAQIHNDLGVAHFELAKAAKDKKLAEQAQSLEEFTKATELDPNLLEALFNKSLALEELAPREAKESWKLYLQKDPSSPWAIEARKHLDRLESEQKALIKTDEQVLADFLTAYRNNDEARAQKIHAETKGLLRSVTVPLQLSRRYLEARQSGNEAVAKESNEAMAFIGSFEQAQNSEFFFLNYLTSTPPSALIRLNN